MAQELYGIQVGDKIEPQEVIGIVDNFHYTSMRRSISPLAIYTFGKDNWITSTSSWS